MHGAKGTFSCSIYSAQRHWLFIIASISSVPLFPARIYIIQILSFQIFQFSSNLFPLYQTTVNNLKSPKFFLTLEGPVPCCHPHPQLTCAPGSIALGSLFVKVPFYANTLITLLGLSSHSGSERLSSSYSSADRNLPLLTLHSIFRTQLLRTGRERIA